MVVSAGKLVTLEYTLKLEDHSVVQTTVGSEPLQYTHGNQQLLPALEQALEGMAVGESKAVRLAPTEAYGAVDPQAFHEVGRDQLPPEALKVGVQLEGRTPDGREIFPRVAEIRDSAVLLDFNHPLAGQTLHFDVKVLDVTSAPPA